uniref:Uncharacterized protein n=1 Tax=Triticum urartu TaxID=4572 RepID=A0A8R7QHF6_TRIUA
MDRDALRMVCSPQFWRMGVLWTLSLLYSYLLLFLRGRTAAPRRREDVGRGGRPICVVTGATSGLGRAAAAALAREGYHVVLAGRSAQLLSEVLFAASVGCLFASVCHYHHCCTLCKTRLLKKFIGNSRMPVLKPFKWTCHPTGQLRSLKLRSISGFGIRIWSLPFSF